MDETIRVAPSMLVLWGVEITGSDSGWGGGSRGGNFWLGRATDAGPDPRVGARVPTPHGQYRDRGSPRGRGDGGGPPSLFRRLRRHARCMGRAGAAGEATWTDDQCRKWRRPVRIMAMPCS